MFPLNFMKCLIHMGMVLGISAKYTISQLFRKCLLGSPYHTITCSVLNSSCFAWHPYEKQELFKTE